MEFYDGFKTELSAVKYFDKSFMLDVRLGSEDASVFKGNLMKK